jgi:tetratricopeptide (TPR) repeat protein
MSASCREFPITLLAYLALASLAGCAPTAVVPNASQLPPARTESRIEQAVEGLIIVSGEIKTKAVRQGRASALQLVEAAESVNNTPVRAAGFFRDAILADPSYSPAYIGLAQSLRLEGKAELAQAALRTAIRLDPKCDQALFELGSNRQMQGDYAGALESWKALVARTPSYPEAYARMAIAAYFAEDLANARKFLAEADQRKQNVPPQFRKLLREAGPKP